MQGAPNLRKVRTTLKTLSLVKALNLQVSLCEVTGKKTILMLLFTEIHGTLLNTFLQFFEQGRKR